MRGLFCNQPIVLGEGEMFLIKYLKNCGTNCCDSKFDKNLNWQKIV